MSTRTYTLYKRADDVSDDVVIARRVGAIDAMRIVVESKPKRRFCTAAENYGSFRRIDWWLHPTEHLSTGPMLHATVPLSDEYLVDLDAALVLIAEQFLRVAHEHWDGWIDLDVDYDERVADGEELTEAGQVAREIAVKFVDALIADGYTISGDHYGAAQEFRRSTDRDGIAAYLAGTDMASFRAHKGGTSSFVRMFLGGFHYHPFAGYSEALTPIVERIIEPYRPWKSLGWVWDSDPNPGEPWRAHI